MPPPVAPPAGRVPRRAERLLGVVLDGEEVLYDPLLREAHLLNPSAAMLLDRCDGRASIDDLVAELQAAHQADPGVIRADVEAALDDFRRRWLVDPPPPTDLVAQRAEVTPGRPAPDRPDAITAPATWAVVTPELHALGRRVRVRSDEPLVGRYVETMFGSLRNPPPGLSSADGPAHTFDVVVGGPGPIQLRLDGAAVGSTTTLASAMSHLQWTLNQLAVAGAGPLVLLHAAAVARGGRVAVLPGASNAGKSTLAAGLVTAGCDYLSDELVALDPASGGVVAYPKPISLDPGSWPLFTDVAPAIDGIDVPLFTDEWHLVPTSLHPGTLDLLDLLADDHGEQPAVALVAFPSYRPGGPTALEPVRPAEGLLLLLQCSFNLATASPQGLATLAQITQRATVARLTVGDLAEAVELVQTELEPNREVGDELH